MTTPYKAVTLHSWQRPGFGLALGLLVFLLVAVPTGLSHHAVSHDHAGEEEGDCSLCIVASQYAAPSAACLGENTVPHVLAATEEGPARAIPGAMIHLPVRGPPLAFV